MIVKGMPTTYAWRPELRGTVAGAIDPRRCDRAKGRLLLVEGDAVIAELFVAILEDEGYAVETASTPLTALALLSERDSRGPDAFDLVLSVPFADPLDAPYVCLDHLRQATGAPIVICARCPALFYADHRGRGYAAFLEEPFEVQWLIDLVAALCPLHPRAHPPRERTLER